MKEDREIKYRDESGKEVTERVTAEQLDRKMDDAEAVYGVEGESKARAAYLARDAEDKPEEPITGEREA
jgi:hypothetical protein